MVRLRWVWVVMVCWLWVAQSAAAQNGYPTPQDNYVNDFAGVIETQDEADIRQLFAQLKADHGIEAVVVTLNSIQDYPTADSSIESFATNLFNTWGIGNRERNDGVLILVAVGDRAMRIEVGSGYGTVYNDEMQEVITEHMLPRFREGDYSLGVVRGAVATIGKLTGEWPTLPSEGAAPDFSGSGAAGPTVGSQTAASSPIVTSPIGRLRRWFMNPFDGVPWWAFGGGIAATAGGAAAWLQRYRRFRKRTCPVCYGEMVRLDEASDDLYLDSGQKLEEVLQSVDYDVWRCPSCNEHQLHRYNRWFSGHSNCPSCGYKTVHRNTRTLVAATYDHGGQQEVISDCQHCNYYHRDVVHTPRKTRSDTSSSSFGSSSSSGSSFGGGSSSGGGASGSW